MSITKEEFKNVYWDYYLELEKELLNIEQYIPIDELNNETFSLKYMKLLFSICSEIDIVFKVFMNFFDNNIDLKKKFTMNNYQNFINNKFPKFSSEIVTCYEKRELNPFNNWKENTSLFWWKEYNNIKHKRTFEDENKIKNHKKASQINVLNALSGLYQLETYFYKEIIDKYNPDKKLRLLVPQSRVFRIKDWEDNDNLINNRYIMYIDDTGHLILEGEL